MKNIFTKKLLIILIFISLSGFAFADSTYIIQKGDTLYSISRKYQITVSELQAANNLLETDIIKIGQKLIIPEADIQTAAALSSTNVSKPQTSKTSLDETEDYIVQKGDTLYGIARNKSMSVSELISINNLNTSDVIKVGQKLKVVKASKGIELANVHSSKENTQSVQNNKKSSNLDSNNKKTDSKALNTVIDVSSSAPDTRTYGLSIAADSSTKWPVKNPNVTQVKGKVSGVQLSASKNEDVICIHEGTVMYVGVYRGFGQVVFILSKTGLIYAYTGLGSVSVKKGDYSLSGSKIGSAGLDSISGKPQITLMVFQNGQPIDPRTAPRN